MVDTLEVPPSMKVWLSAMWEAVTHFDERTQRYELDHVRAFAVCLALTRNDARAATVRFTELLNVMDDWTNLTAARRESSGVMMPIP